MITDREITIRATAEGEDPNTIRVSEIMTPETIWCYEDQLLNESARLMQDFQIRRILVLDQNKKLVGILSLGDLATRARDEEMAGLTLENLSEPSLQRASR